MTKEHLIDLEPDQLGLLEQILKQHIPNKTVWAYGSRVTWKADERSDLDLTVFDCNLTETGTLKDALEESNLLVSVDVMNWESIPENFKENIREKYVVLQEKTKLEGWREVKLGDVMEIIGGGTPKTNIPEYWGGDIPWLTPRDLSNFSGRYISKGERNISDLGLLKSSAKSLPKGTVLLTTRAPVGYLAIAKNEVSTNQGFRSLIPNKEVDNLFLLYLLKQNVEYLKSQSEGTTFGELAGSTLKSLSFLFPPLPEQKAIAEILSSLDDKIDLLHRQNKTLEDMAQTLFRKWFVEDADEAWEEKPLGKTVDISIGRTPPRKEFQWFSKSQGNWKWVSIKDMADNGIYLFHTSEYLTQEAVEKFNIPVIPKNTVILSFKMTVGRVKITTEEMLSNEAIAQFKFKPDTPYNKEYLYFYLKTFRFDSLGSTSSIVTSINTAMIKSLMIKIPDTSLIEKFGEISKTLFEKAYSNQQQICALENLRDTLLPKLMSGSVRVLTYA